MDSWTQKRIEAIEANLKHIESRLMPVKHPNPDFEIARNEGLLDSLQDKMAAIRGLCEDHWDKASGLHAYRVIAEVYNLAKDDE